MSRSEQHFVNGTDVEETAAEYEAAGRGERSSRRRPALHIHDFGEKPRSQPNQEPFLSGSLAAKYVCSALLSRFVVLSGHAGMSYDVGLGH